MLTRDKEIRKEKLKAWAKIQGCCSKALRNAVRRRLVPYNVCDLVTLPRQPKRKTQVLTKEQVIQLLKVARGYQMEPLIVLGLGLGMRHGLPRLKVHELRHNAATLLAARMNRPANVVQNLLGHEDIETTLGLYGHADLDMQRKMMADLDEFLGDLSQEG